VTAVTAAMIDLPVIEALLLVSAPRRERRRAEMASFGPGLAGNAKVTRFWPVEGDRK
jgi:hypothetical protein